MLDEQDIPMNIVAVRPFDVVEISNSYKVSCC